MKVLLFILSAMLILAASATTASAQVCPKQRCPVPETVPVGQVCFYTSEDYSNRFFCETGTRTVNKIDASWKHNIKSIQVFNGGSVWICNKEDRKGQCENIDHSVRKLSPDLYDKLYSFRTSDT